MSERGVFAVDRGIWDDPDFPAEPFSEREAFLWLVSEAAWRATKVRVGSATIELQRGQCAFSTRFMAAKWSWSEARVRRYLERRMKCGSIDASTDARATRITICNYDKFQRVGLPTDALGVAAASQQRRSSDAKKKQGNIETGNTSPIGEDDHGVESQADLLSGIANPETEDAALYRRGAEVLKGNRALVTKLKQHHRGNIALARADLERASVAHDARGYIGGILARQNNPRAGPAGRDSSRNPHSAALDAYLNREVT